MFYNRGGTHCHELVHVAKEGPAGPLHLVPVQTVVDCGELASIVQTFGLDPRNNKPCGGRDVSIGIFSGMDIKIDVLKSTIQVIIDPPRVCQLRIMNRVLKWLNKRVTDSRT